MSKQMHRDEMETANMMSKKLKAIRVVI